MMRGVAAFGRGQAAAALTEYETAKTLAPKANAPYRYAAQALVSLGRYVEAVENLEAYLRKNPSVSDAAEVREKIAKLKADFYPARLRVDVDAPNAVVRVDDEPKGPPGALEVAPGRHRIEVHAPGRASAAQDVVLVGDRDASLSFTLRVEEEARPLAPPPASRTATRHPTPWPTLGWVGVGAGGAALAAALIIDVAVLGPKVDDYNAAAARGDVGARELRDSASGWQTATLATYVAGGLIAAGGAALLLFAPRDSLRGAGIVPAVGPGHGGLVTRFAF